MKTWMWMVVGGLGLLGLGVALLRSWMSGPFYVPGTLSRRGDLEPPAAAKEDSNDWQVTQDVKLRHFKSGDGAPILVVHGGPGRPPDRPWRAAAFLGRKYTLHFYHQRGCGDSTRPVDRSPEGNVYQGMKHVEQALGLGAQVADMERIRRILRQEQMVLVGHSFGGFMAALYAAEFPERVKALVLVAPANLVTLPKEGEDLFALVRRKLPERDVPAYDRYMERFFDFPSLLGMDERGLSEFYGQLDPYFAAATGAVLPPSSPSGGGWMPMAVYLSMGRKHDYTSAFKSIRAPELVIHGRQDMIPVEDSARIKDLIPAARLEVVDGAGHFVFDDQPERFAALVEQFLDR